MFSWLLRNVYDLACRIRRGQEAPKAAAKHQQNGEICCIVVAVNYCFFLRVIHKYVLRVIRSETTSTNNVSSYTDVKNKQAWRQPSTPRSVARRGHAVRRILKTSKVVLYRMDPTSIFAPTPACPYKKRCPACPLEEGQICTGSVRCYQLLSPSPTGTKIFQSTDSRRR